jgi:hypothetical protein
LSDIVIHGCFTVLTLYRPRSKTFFDAIEQKSVVFIGENGDSYGYVTLFQAGCDVFETPSRSIADSTICHPVMLVFPLMNRKKSPVLSAAIPAGIIPSF